MIKVAASKETVKIKDSTEKILHYLFRIRKRQLFKHDEADATSSDNMNFKLI